MPSAIRDVSGAIQEWTCISGFRKNSSSRDKTPKMRLSVLMISLDNFFPNLPSISSETWVIWSSCDLGAIDFFAHLFLACSSKLSLFRAASYGWFLNVAIFYGKIMSSAINTEVFFMEKFNLLIAKNDCRKQKNDWLLSQW